MKLIVLICEMEISNSYLTGHYRNENHEYVQNLKFLVYSEYSVSDEMMMMVTVTVVMQSTSIIFGVKLRGRERETNTQICPEMNLVARDHFCSEHICREGQILASLCVIHVRLLVKAVSGVVQQFRYKCNRQQ